MASPLPKWLQNLMLAEDAAAYGTAPSLNHVVARSGGVRQPRSPEDFLRSLMADAQRAEEAAARSVDDSYAGGVNMFGNQPRTMGQSMADAMRQFPDFDKLPIEDQMALMGAIEKGQILKGMPAFGEASSVGRGSFGPGGFVAPEIANRLDRMTNNFGGAKALGLNSDPTMANVMATLQNKSDFEKLTGFAAGDMPPPPAFRQTSEGVVPSRALRVAGDDVTELAKTLRNDQVQSRLMQAQEALDEMNLTETQNAMAEAADAVAAKEAYARQYGGLDPQTTREMERATRRLQMERKGTLSKLTNDPLHDLNKEPEWDAAVLNEAERATERVAGNDILKGAALGHVLSYPAMYAVYRAQQDGTWPFGGSELGAERIPQEPARTIGVKGSMQDDPFMAAVGDLDTVPVELPEMPFIPTPTTQVSLPEDDAIALDSLGGEAELAAETSPPPGFSELDELLDDSGLINAGTSPENAARRKAVWAKMQAGDDLNALMREAGLGAYEGDLSQVDQEYLRRRGSIYSPDSLNYALEQEYRRRGGNPYPQLRR